ncbi:1-O-acylceramide synthase [Entamoeba marina]
MHFTCLLRNILFVFVCVSLTIADNVFATQKASSNIHSKNVLKQLLNKKSLTQCSQRHPVFLMHGLLSSSLMIEGDITGELPDECPRTFGPYQIWLNTADIFPFNHTACFLKYITPEWSEAKQSLENIEGANLYYPNYPSVDGIASLAPEEETIAHTVLRVWHKMISQLERIGYKNGVDLFAPGYDWRYADLKRNDWISQTSELVKTAVENSGHKAVFVTHSYGGVMMLEALELFGKDFCDTYIEKVIAISAPYLGAVKMLKSLLSGENEGVPMDPLIFRSFVQGMESTFQLLPNENYWDGVIMKYQGVEYKGSDMKEILKLVELNLNYAEQIYGESLQRYNYNYVPNNVSLHCLYSGGIETQTYLEYGESFEEEPTITYGDGDGSVNSNSLQWCLKSGFSVTSKYIGKVEHMDMVKNTDVIDYVKGQVCYA